MNFKKLRYNLIVIGLVALVACYLGMSFLLSQPANAGDPGSNAGNSGIIVEPEPPEDDPNEEEPGEDVNVPIDPWELLEFSLDILNNGKGYESTFKSAVVNTAHTTGFGPVPATQYMDGKVIRGVNSKGEKVSVEENYFYSFESGMAAGSVANYFKGFYVNNDTGMTQVGITSDYNYKNQTFNLANASRNQTMTTENALSEFKILQGLDFPIKINKNTVKIINNDTSGKTYREIAVVYKNPASLPRNYIDYYTCSGQMKDVKYSSLTITFKIHNKTGNIYSIKREEAFNATAINAPVIDTCPLTSKVTTVQTFTKMNKTIELRDSL